MNDIKTCCIDSRKAAITSSYDGNDENIINMIDDFFTRLEEFSKDCCDVADFEAKFQVSPLAGEYTNLFTKIMGSNIDTKREAREALMFTGEEIADNVAHRARMEARQEVESELRNTPIVGDVMTAKQHFDFFSRFRKKKDDN